MSTQHPADARHQARTALASMPPARRAFLEALHAEYFPPRSDGMAYRLEDLLCHLAQGAHYGWEDGKVAPALRVPADYLRVLREAAGV
jgi:hypothetical protein